MAGSDDRHNFARPQMLYGDWSSSLDKNNASLDKNNASLDNEFPEQNGGRGSKLPKSNIPQQGRAMLIRSVSRKLRRFSKTEISVEGVTPRRASVTLDNDVPSAQPSLSLEADVQNRSINNTSRQTIKSKLSDNQIYNQTEKVDNSNLHSGTYDEKYVGLFNSSIKNTNLDSRKSALAETESDIHESKVDNPISYSYNGLEDDHLKTILGKASLHSRNAIPSENKDYIRKRSADVGTRQSEIISTSGYRSGNRRRSVENISELSRNSKSPELKSKYSYVHEDNAIRTSSNSTAFEYRNENRNRSVEVATRQSRISKSMESRQADDRARSIATRNNIRFNPSRKSRLFHQLSPKLPAISRATTYDHGDILDDNLLISASKLDNTLIRLFSHTRKKNEDKDQQDPGTALMPFMNYSQSDMISMDAVFWRVFPMDAAQRETLDQELPYIEVNMTPNDIMKDLYNNEILTHMDYNQLTRTEGQGDKAVIRLMVKTLQRRGDKAYPAFMEALQAHEFFQIYERLSETERSLRKGMSTDLSETARRDGMDDISSRRHTSQRMTPNGTLSVKRTNEILSPPTSAISTNQLSSTTNVIHSEISNSPPSDHATSSDLEFPTNQMTNFDSHVTSDQPIVDPKKLEQQLLDIMAELEALQGEVNNMKSARSLSDRQRSISGESGETDHNSDTVFPDTLTQSLSAHPGPNTENNPEVTDQDVLQRTSSCTVL